MKPALRVAGSILTAVLFTACADTGQEAGDADQLPPANADAPAAPAANQQETSPDTTAAALWAFLEEEAYRDNWQLWPGKDRLYTGTEPHGMLLTTYTNRTAYDALMAGQVADLPAGSIIVKENWMPDSTYDAATVMYKVDGYNPDHQDWLFAKFNAAGAPDAFGRAPMCQACHAGAESGYVYTAVQR